MLRHSDSTEDITSDLFSGSSALHDANLAGMDDLDLDKELGLDEPDEHPKQSGKQKAIDPAAVKTEDQAGKSHKDSTDGSSTYGQHSAGAALGGWWGAAWSGAASLVSTATATAQSSDITKAMKNATEKATAAVTSINEQYKITEGLANVASIVEKKGENLKNATLHSVDKILDAIDPIPLPTGHEYSAQDYEEEGLLAKIKVIVSTVDAVEIGAVIKVLEKIYGEEHVYASGAPAESGMAKQTIGMKNGMWAAQSKVNSLMAMDSFKDKTDFIFVALESFIEEVDGEWFEFYAVVLFDRKNKITAKGFSQGVSLPSEVAEKVRALTPTEYPFREFGASVTVASIMSITNPSITDSNWYSVRTDGRVDKSLALELAVGAVCGNYWTIMKETGLIPKN